MYIQFIFPSRSTADIGRSHRLNFTSLITEKGVRCETLDQFSVSVERHSETGQVTENLWARFSVYRDRMECTHYIELIFTSHRIETHFRKIAHTSVGKQHTLLYMYSPATPRVCCPQNSDETVIPSEQNLLSLTNFMYEIYRFLILKTRLKMLHCIRDRTS